MSLSFDEIKALLLARAVDKDPIAEAEAARAARTEAASARWRQITPMAYWVDDDKRHPLHSAIASDWRKVAAGKLFLLLLGDSRSGKTWTGYKALRRELWHQRSVTAYRCSTLCEELSSLFRDEPLQSLALMRRLKTVDVLFLDDIDKAVMTERFAEQLFDLIDERSANLRHTLITANTSPEMLQTLLEKNGLRFAGPMLNRIQEQGTLVVSRFVGDKIQAEIVSKTKA